MTAGNAAATLSIGAADPPRQHPRVLGWVRTTALAMGGSNQSLFLISALLVTGLVLSIAAMPGWIELLLMWPDRVGGVAAVCGEAFRPYSAVLANLAGTCYWWGWVPTCGLTALISAAALHSWALPWVPVSALAIIIVAIFAVLTFNYLTGRINAVESALARSVSELLDEMENRDGRKPEHREARKAA